MDVNPAGSLSTSAYAFTVTPAEPDLCANEAMAVGDPVDTRSGKFSFTEHDLGVETGCDTVALRFARTYNTHTLQDSVLSAGWTHNYEQRITSLARGRTVLVQGPDGAFLRFNDVRGSVYATAPGSHSMLLKRNGRDTRAGWALVYRNRRVDLFNAQGQLEAQQDPHGNMLWMTYESYRIGRRTETRLAGVHAQGSRYLRFAYDASNPTHLVSVSDHTGRTVQFGYDTTGRLTTVIDPMRATAIYSYTERTDSGGSSWLLVHKRDALGQTVFENTYDDDGRVVLQVNNLGQTLTLSYATITTTAAIVERVGPTEAAGLAALLETTVTDQAGAVASYTYGGDGLLRRMTDPTGATTHYRAYTTTRQPTEIEDAQGNLTRLRYNELGLPEAITDALNNQVQVAYDAWGNPTVMTDTLNQAYTFTYDANFNLTAFTNPLGETTRFQYGTQSGWQGMLNAIVEPGNASTTLNYNTAGDMTTITDPLGRATRLTYDPLGRPVEIAEPHSGTTTLVYDAADRIQCLIQRPAPGQDSDTDPQSASRA